MSPDVVRRARALALRRARELVLLRRGQQAAEAGPLPSLRRDLDAVVSDTP